MHKNRFRACRNFLQYELRTHPWVFSQPSNKCQSRVKSTSTPLRGTETKVNLLGFVSQNGSSFIQSLRPVLSHSIRQPTTQNPFIAHTFLVSLSSGTPSGSFFHNQRICDARNIGKACSPGCASQGYLKGEALISVDAKHDPRP